MKTPLQEWISKNIPDDKMLWKNSAIDQAGFVRDRILCALKGKDQQEFQEIKSTFMVISEHTSKSITLPVYSFTWRGVVFIFRDNFYDWKVSVQSENEIAGIDGFDLFDPKKTINSCYCEGFKDEWVFPAYNDNKENFTVEIRSNHDLYCFFKILTCSNFEVYCHACSEAGGADRPIHHLPPACK